MLIENTLFLRRNYPIIRQYFIDNEENLDLTNIEVLPSRIEVPTIRFKMDGNKQLMVHSSYDPIKEATRVISQHEGNLKSDTHVFFYGIGLGYHIEELIRRFPNITYSVYEPSPEMFLTTSKSGKLENFITKNTKQLYLDFPGNQDLNYTQEFLEENRNIHIIIHPGYENIFIEKKERFLNNIKNTVRNRSTSVHTSAAFQKLWVLNSLINFKEVLNTPNILRDVDTKQFEGMPTIIVSAGPSLAEDIEHIRYIKENNLAYIFSVGSAINSLISYDILPDAVFTYDPSLVNYKVFEKMIDEDIDAIPMVFGSSVGHETLTRYQGPKVHFITSQDRSSLYFLRNQLDLEHDLILDSPSIAVMTFQILNRLGAGPIIFVGQNLGYLYDRLYSEGIEYDHIQSKMDKDKLDKAPIVQDVYGNDIKTSIGFNSMRESIESFAEMFKENTFINTTRGGAAIKGIPFQPIEEVIEKTLITPINKTKWWSAENQYKQSSLDKKQAELKNSIKAFHIILNKFGVLLETIDANTRIKNKAQLEKTFIQFDQLYSELLDNEYYKQFLSFYIRVHVLYMSNEIKRLNLERDTIIKGNAIMNTFSNFIGQCKNGSFELEEVVKDAI